MVIKVYYWSFVVAVIFRHAISGHPFIKPLCIVIICIEMSPQILVVLVTHHVAVKLMALQRQSFPNTASCQLLPPGELCLKPAPYLSLLMHFHWRYVIYMFSSFQWHYQWLTWVILWSVQQNWVLSHVLPVSLRNILLWYFQMKRRSIYLAQHAKKE